jgi:L-asparaginase II
VLDRVGLSTSDLAVPPVLPYGADAARAVLAGGGTETRAQHNCSGKHAWFLAACVVQGWPVAGYCDIAHPLQQHLRRVVEELAREKIALVGVDGCGAPIFGLSLRGLATGYRQLVLAPPQSAEATVAGVMRAHPELVGGSGRDVTALMQRVPGLLAKDGAEGVYAVATRDGAVVAVKIEDGSLRGCAPVAVAALRALGALDALGDDALDDVCRPEVRGGHTPAGFVRAAPGLFS